MHGAVAPGSTVRMFHPQAGVDGEEIYVNPETGAYGAYWTVSGSWAGAGVTRVELLVRGSKAGAGIGGTPAVADKQMWVLLPPSQETYEYDGAGRMVGDATWAYTWNGMGCLVKMERKADTGAESNLASEVITFKYDADRRRTKKERTLTYSDSTPTRVETSKMIWSGWLPACEELSVNGGTASRRWFVWGRDVSGTWDGAGGIGGLVAIEEEGGRRLLVVDDGLGNITALINQANGDTVAKFDYTPFGELKASTGDVNACPFRYQGKYYDAETGLSYFGFRYYSAKLGRWISRDPLGESGGFNLYGYCGNDPVNRWDYLGLSDIPTHLELSDRAAQSPIIRELLRSAGLRDNDIGEFVRGIFEGVVYNDFRVRIPMPKYGTPIGYVKELRQFLEIKDYVPQKIKSGVAAIDGAVDGVQRKVMNYFVPGYAETRDGYELWMKHTPSAAWTVMDLIEKKSPSWVPVLLKNYMGDLHSTHMGAGAWEHFMSFGGEGVDELKRKVVEATVSNAGEFQRNMKAGKFRDAGFYLGRSLHMVQDSNSPAHVGRDQFGDIAGVYDYTWQSPLLHSHADNPNRLSLEYRRSFSATVNMIRDHLQGRAHDANVIDSYYKLAPGAVAGGAGDYAIPEGTIFPQAQYLRAMWWYTGRLTFRYPY